MQRLTLCPHCDAIPGSAQARFCGKCGKPLNLQCNSQNSVQLNAAAPANPSVCYWAGAAPVVANPPVVAAPPLSGASVSGASAASSSLGTAAPTAPTQPIPTQPSGTPLAIVAPAYSAKITPAFKERQRRIRFACVASPIIGVGLGAEPTAILGLMLTQYGLPPVLVPLGAMAAFGGLTAYIAHVIMADKVSWISNMVSGSMFSGRNTDQKTDRKSDRGTDRKTEQATDKKVEPVAPLESVSSRRVGDHPKMSSLR